MYEFQFGSLVYEGNINCDIILLLLFLLLVLLVTWRNLNVQWPCNRKYDNDLPDKLAKFLELLVVQITLHGIFCVPNNLIYQEIMKNEQV